jgi:siroheme synthase
MVYGKVFLVGAGPGDPQLLTIKAVKVLKEADVVIYDRLVGEAILCLAPEKAQMIYVGKRSGKHEVPQDQITALIVEKAKAGGNVVRLKGGDPFIFGRGGEEAEALAEKGIAFEVVPGVSSAVVAPAYTGHRAGDAEKPVNWVKIAKAVDTMVILMGVESLEGIVGKLLKGGISPDKPAAMIESGTYKQQRALISTLGAIVKEAADNKIKPPAVIVIGDVANLGRKLAWFKKPL